MTRHRAAGRGRRRPAGGALLAVLTVAAAVATVLTMVSTGGPDAPPVPVPAERGVAAALPGPPPAAPAPDLVAAVGAAEEAAEEAGPSGLDLGIAVLDRVSGVTEVGAGGDEVFNAASLSKLFVAVDVLDQRRRGTDVDAADVRQVSSSLGPSSDPAMNALWSGFDGNAGVGRLVAGLGLAETAAPDDPSQWGEVQTSARDVVRLFGHVRDGVPAADRDLLLDALRDPPARAADGFDQGYGLLDEAAGDDGAAPVEPIKQGWLCCLRNSVDLHSAGIVADRWVVAVLTNQPRGWDRARTTVDAAVRSLRGSLLDTPAG